LNDLPFFARIVGLTKEIKLRVEGNKEGKIQTGITNKNLLTAR